MVQEILKTQYPFNGSNSMHLKVGQVMKAGDIEFMISHIKIHKEPGAYITQVFVRPLDNELTALWKEIVNGSHVNSFSVDFLCKSV